MFQEKLLLPLQKQWHREAEKVIPLLFASSVRLYIPFCTNWDFFFLFPKKKKKKKLLIKLNKIGWRLSGKTLLMLAPHRVCTMKRMVRKCSPSDKTPWLNSLVLWKSSTASECLVPIQPWSQAAPCRFVHLAREMSSGVMEGIVQAEAPPPAWPHLFHLSWALAHRQGYTRNGCELRDMWVTPQQSFLCSTSRGVSVMAELLSLGSEQPWHHTAFTQLESTR